MNVNAIARSFVEVELAHVVDPELPSRTEMDEAQLEELAQNIREIGLQQPIILARDGDSLRVVAGHRRTLACRRAGLAKVPAIVYERMSEALDAVQYAENRFREELTPTDEAIWFAELLAGKCENDTDRLAALVGEKRSYVEGRLALFLGDPRVFEALQQKQIVIGVAQEINRCTDHVHRALLLDMAITNGATVGIARSWIAEWKRLHEPATRDLRNQTPGDLPPPVPLGDPFTCAACGSKDHPSSMRPIQMHDYCIQANFKPALELWKRQNDYLRAPRTQDEAIELVNELLERFPGIGQDEGPRRI